VICKHERLTVDVCDQTLAVVCIDCDHQLAVCWMDEHIPESLWNRACANDCTSRPCEQSRDDVCAICEEKIGG
jgi:hypothetical protein